MIQDIIGVLESGKANIKIEVNGEDLKQFAETLINRGVDIAREEIKKEERYLTKREVLDTLGVCDTTLWHWRRNGYLIPRKLGRKILYAKSDIDRCLAVSKKCSNK